jgi:hypothetical protein
VVFRAFGEAQAVGLVISALNLATRSMLAEPLISRGLYINKIATQVASTHRSAIKERLEIEFKLVSNHLF